MSGQTRFIENLNEEADSFTSDKQIALQSDSELEDTLGDEEEEVIAGNGANDAHGAPVTPIAVNKAPPPTDILSPQELAEWIRLKFAEATEGDEEKWGSIQANLLADRSMASTRQTYLTMSDAENYVHTVCGFTKVPEEHQIGKTP